MADESRAPKDSLSSRQLRQGDASGSPEGLLDVLSRAAPQFDFFQVLRRIDMLTSGGRREPRLGSALRPADEPIRIGQEPELAFASTALSGLVSPTEGGRPRLMVNFFGLFGPNGPLPLHITEYARDRLRNGDDPTMARFFDLFHHRMLLFFYRAWATAQPTVSRDRPESDRFEHYIGALIGSIPPWPARSAAAFPDTARLFYAGHLGAQSRNAEGLAAIIGDFFGMPSRIDQFVGGWIDLPEPYRWRLGGKLNPAQLGFSTVTGASAWAAQQKFQVVLGPLTQAQFRRMLPGGRSLPRLTALVRSYVGQELRWDVRLVLDERVEEPWRMGGSRLGWTAWLGGAVGERREDLVLDPEVETVSAGI
jgi:type VI secretion system protein ImpH